MSRKVYALYDACLYNEIESLNEEVYKEYGFINCETEQMRKKLFEMYQDLFFNHLLRIYKSRDAFLRIMEIKSNENKLHEFILEIYNKYDDSSQYKECLYNIIKK